MEKIYTLIQPSMAEESGGRRRNISTRIEEITRDFNPNRSFDFEVTSSGGPTYSTSSIESFKQLIAADMWWQCADAEREDFFKKCAEYSANDNRINRFETEAFKITVEKPKDHVNPVHYQNYLEIGDLTLQWLETQQYLPRFRDPQVFKGAVELQARKYLDRLGGKDEESQEIMKAVWYLKFLAAYIKNGGPIRVKDIDHILSGAHASSNGS